MADLKIDFSNCDVSIEKMFDIHDNQNVNFYSNVPNLNKRPASRGRGKASTNTDTKPEKQHGVNYPVFSKGLGVTEYHIQALYKFLTGRGWISTQTKEVDFQRLFSGNDNACEIIWTGKDKLGNNPETDLGKAALYVLFKKMVDEKHITISCNSKRVGPILESHFVDTEGHFLTDISNISTTSNKANDYISKILVTMRIRANKEFIEDKLNNDLDELVEKEGEVIYDKYGG